MKKVKVRFPPSPTGYCHVGTARMALLNFLFGKKHGGTIIFRSEDTDKARSKREYEDDIVDSLTWLGLAWDEFYRDSELIDTHREALKKLIDAGKAYVSKEESMREPGKEVEVVRLKNPGMTITFSDVIRGEITFDTTELGDFVIARSIDDPLYHLAVVVDDGEMGITHVIRGEEHISNTPRQILIQEALGYERPIYAHYPLFLSSDRAKLSKRKGDVAVKEYRAEGFLPEALLNFIGILGWTPPSGREILSLQEMVTEFELENLHKSGAVFDMEKLRWFNREYLLKMRDDDFEALALDRLRAALTERKVEWSEGVARKLMRLVHERVSVWSDIDELAGEGEFDYFFSDPQPGVAELPQKNTAPEEAARHLEAVVQMLHELPDADFSVPENIKAVVWPYAEEKGRGNVLWPLRYSLSGRAKSPDPFLIASIIGKDTSLRRIKAAIGLLERMRQ
ncbi:MAG TPA: glutamate--tRNA ligase [Candidatus Paceibacterota bacterium]|jgi:glutamyl-tRNA synthetase|nr:glutamate--tRNA ligase [Candidatus Paceibacterota bacterium]